MFSNLPLLPRKHSAIPSVDIMVWRFDVNLYLCTCESDDRVTCPAVLVFVSSREKGVGVARIIPPNKTPRGCLKARVLLGHILPAYHQKTPKSGTEERERKRQESTPFPTPRLGSVNTQQHPCLNRCSVVSSATAMIMQQGIPQII